MRWPWCCVESMADGASNQLFVFHLILAQLLKESVWDH